MLNIIEVKDAINYTKFIYDFLWLKKQFIKIIATETLLISCSTFASINWLQVASHVGARASLLDGLLRL